MAGPRVRAEAGSRPPAATAVAHLSELFSSFQGEGPLVGVRQLFLRLAGCPVRCPYCDQPEALTRTQEWRVEDTPGARDFRQLPNPVGADALLEHVRRLERPAGLHHSLSVTGGEPLLQHRFLAEFLPEARRVVDRVYLNTSGLVPDGLEAILDHVHHVALDVKLPSTAEAACDLEATRRSLRLARRRDYFLKMVVGPRTTVDELRRVLEALDAPPSVLVLQPLTPFGELRVPPPGLFLDLQRGLSGSGMDVRIIPQTHVYLQEL